VRITDLVVERFRYESETVRDSEGHSHPGPRHEASGSLLRVMTDEGIEGYALGGNLASIVEIARPLLVGEDPLYRERIWQGLRERQRLHLGSFSDAVLASVDEALWDLAGRACGQPVFKLLGAYRDRVMAYASTMCGDDLIGGLNTPEAYADFALACLERGYRAFKLHTWQPPVVGAPDVRRDVEACVAVRKAVGDRMALMLDPYHYYSRIDACYLGRALQELDFAWIEEPMDEDSVSSYVWLADELQLPVCGPETAAGKLRTRAEWITRGAIDICRAGVGDVGGITPLIKAAHLSEAFGIDLEVHGGGAANLHALCAMGSRGRYYERGLLHPYLDYEKPKPWLFALEDPMDAGGSVRVSQGPGLGLEIDFGYIRAHAL